MGSHLSEPAVLTLGTFDILHDGHRAFLRNASRLGRLTVGVNSDRFVTTYKPAAVNAEAARMAAIADLAFVDDVCLNDGPGCDVIRALRPRFLAVGPDWLSQNYLGQIGLTEEEFFSLDIALLFLPPARKPGLSSREIRERLS